MDFAEFTAVLFVFFAESELADKVKSELYGVSEMRLNTSSRLEGMACRQRSGKD